MSWALFLRILALVECIAFLSRCETAPTAGLCGDNSPAIPVPECRNAASGEPEACDAPGTVRLWAEIRPGRPGETLPEERDSTQWSSATIPGWGSGHELFYSLDIDTDRLFVAYNAGLQIWDIGGDKAEDPERLAVADGWRGDFFTPFQTGENDFLIDDVAGVALGDGESLVALSGRAGVGLSVWTHSGRQALATQLYQDPATATRRVRVVELGGRWYAFAGGTHGVFVYDLTEAADIGPCLDNAGELCPGVYRGRVSDQVTSVYIDTITRAGKVYVANSSGIGFPLQIWEVPEPASPATAALRFSGLAGALGEAFFELDDFFYLAVVEWVEPSWVLRIYDVTECLDRDGCGSLLLRWESALSHLGSNQLLTYSTSDSRPFLYYGLQATSLEGPAIEKLLDLSDFPASVREITAFGERYTDPCNGLEIDYWGDYYSGNDSGLRNLSPRVGKFRGKYFYRAAFGILDVHVTTSSVIFLGSFESGNTSRWSNTKRNVTN